MFPKCVFLVGVFAALSLSIPAAEQDASDAPAVDDAVIQEVLAGFEQQRELDAQRRRNLIAELKSGKPVAAPNEAGVVKQYEEFYAQNPALRRFEPSSRGRIEAERSRAAASVAAAKKAAAAEIKRLEAEGRRMARQMFVPHYGDDETYHVAELARLSQYPGEREKPSLGWKTVGLYAAAFRVERIIDENRAIVSVGKKNTFDQEEMCLRMKTTGLQVGAEITLADRLFYTPRIEKVSYSTGENTSVSGQPLVVIAPYPGQLEDLVAAWEKQVQK